MRAWRKYYGSKGEQLKFQENAMTNLGVVSVCWALMIAEKRWRMITIVIGEVSSIHGYVGVLYQK